MCVINDVSLIKTIELLQKVLIAFGPALAEIFWENPFELFSSGFLNSIGNAGY